MTQGAIRLNLGDPVPWFSARTLAGGSFDLQVAAGRWIVLAFLGNPAEPRTAPELAELMQARDLFHPDRMVCYAVLTRPPADPAQYADPGTNAFAALADYDGAISAAFGANDMPRTVILDPMLRAIANIPWDYAAGHAQAVH